MWLTPRSLSEESSTYAAVVPRSVDTVTSVSWSLAVVQTTRAKAIRVRIILKHNNKGQVTICSLLFCRPTSRVSGVAPGPLTRCGRSAPVWSARSLAVADLSRGSPRTRVKINCDALRHDTAPSFVDSRPNPHDPRRLTRAPQESHRQRHGCLQRSGRSRSAVVCCFWFFGLPRLDFGARFADLSAPGLGRGQGGSSDAMPQY